jgi:hypothetical protein
MGAPAGKPGWGDSFPVAGRVDPRKPPRLVSHYANKRGLSWEEPVSDSEETAVHLYREALAIANQKS